MNDVIRALNPYEELGVERNADGADIRKAYRQLSKERHPDAGGDPAGWERLKRAYDVLMDEGLRKTYDDTGRVEEDRPDNDRAAALQIIQGHFGAILNAYLLAEAKAKLSKHPRNFDVPGAISDMIEEEITQAESAIPNGREVLAFYRDVKGRFTIKDAAKVGHDFLSRMIDDQIRQTEEQIRGLEGNVRVRKLALEIVAGYDFRRDEYRSPLGGAFFLDPDDYHRAAPSVYTWPGSGS